MATPVLYDSVSLQHFAVAHLLPILQGIHGGRQEPRWVTTVRDEVSLGASQHTHCKDVIEFQWLGAPQDPHNLIEVFRIQKGLSSEGDPPTKHLGEAMSIVLAEELNGSFVTDDHAAYDLARRRPNLGIGRVFDTCSLLEHAVSIGEITRIQSKTAHKQITDADRVMHCHCSH